MNERITITMDPKIVSKLRKIQSAQIVKTNKTVSYSKIVDEVLRKGLKQ